MTGLPTSGGSRDITVQDEKTCPAKLTETGRPFGFLAGSVLLIFAAASGGNASSSASILLRLIAPLRLISSSNLAQRPNGRSACMVRGC